MDDSSNILASKHFYLLSSVILSITLHQPLISMIYLRLCYYKKLQSFHNLNIQYPASHHHMFF